MSAEDDMDFLQLPLFIVEVFYDESFLPVRHPRLSLLLKDEMRAKRARDREPDRVVMRR
jgi:hypothetical protein